MPRLTPFNIDVVIENVRGCHIASHQNHYPFDKGNKYDGYVLRSSYVSPINFGYGLYIDGNYVLARNRREFPLLMSIFKIPISTSKLKLFKRVAPHDFSMNVISSSMLFIRTRNLLP